MKLPSLLYHAAPECVYESINIEGLRATYGEVYAAGSMQDAATFMAFRLLDHVHGAKWIEINGVQHPVPDLVQHDSVHFWVIDTAKTDPALWEEGTDHNPLYFNATSYVYRGAIARDALLDALSVKREDFLTASK